MKRFMIAAVFLAAVVDAVDPPGVINAAVQAAATQVAAGATGTSVCAQATAACATATSCVDNTTLLAKQVLCTQAANLFYECPGSKNESHSPWHVHLVSLITSHHPCSLLQSSRCELGPMWDWLRHSGLRARLCSLCWWKGSRSFV